MQPVHRSVVARRDQPTDDARLVLHSDTKRRSVALGPAKNKCWQPSEGLTSADVQTVIDAAAEGRDRLLLRCLWATGGRVSEALALWPVDIRADGLVLPQPQETQSADQACFAAHWQPGPAGAVAALVEAAGLVRRRSPLLLTQTCRRWRLPGHLPYPGLEDRQRGVHSCWCPGAGHVTVQPRRRR